MSENQQSKKLRGPVLSLDLGQRRVGVALSDSLLISIRRLDALNRSSWKQLLTDVSNLIERFDAKTLVVGLPLQLDGATGPASEAASEIARKFSLSLIIPVYLQDERLTSVDAAERLKAEGMNQAGIADHIDSEAAAIILRDFIASQ